MTRKYSTYHTYNIVGFSYLLQEHIRVVRFVPENRLVCAENIHSGSVWAHPADIGDPEKSIVLPGWENGYTDVKNPFEEVPYTDIVRAGWEEYLKLIPTLFDFRDAVILTVREDTDTLRLEMEGGRADGQHLIPAEEDLPAGRYALVLRKPVEIRAELSGALLPALPCPARVCSLSLTNLHSFKPCSILLRLRSVSGEPMGILLDTHGVWMENGMGKERQ